MTWEAWVVMGLVLATLGLLVASRWAADYVLLGGLALLMALRILTPEEALAGFANPGLVTVGALYLVVAGLSDAGAVQWMGRLVLGASRGLRRDLARLMLPVMGCSAFLNNTPVVAMMVPVVQDWCRRNRLSVSSFMLPLSYAAILGGTCSLIGTSTNLIVHGLVLKHTDLGPMGFFSIGAVGLPVALVGMLFVLLFSRWLLPARKAPFVDPADAREYVIELAVDSGSPLVGQTIEEAGLRHLPGAFVAEIERGAGVLPAVSPMERLQANDRLLFVGILDSVADLVKQKGLIPVPDQLFKLDVPRPERRLVEAVISETSPMAGKSIREARFRSRYGAVVVAVARNGDRLRGKIGDIVLLPGDTLLLEARPAFIEQQRNSRDFLLVSALRDWALPRHERAGWAVAVLGAMVLAVVLGWLSMVEAAMLAAGAMILTRCTTGSAARARIDWSVLLVIGASIGLGQAMQVTGAADWVARQALVATGAGPWGALAAIYVVTALFTAVMTNNAAAVLVFPIAQAAAQTLNVSLWPFVVVIMMAASACFATPIGYQTNLMVYGPGGYRFSDYLRIGLPMNLVTGVVAVALTPRFWPF